MIYRSPRPMFVIPLVFLAGAAAARLPATLSALRHGDDDFLAPISDVEHLLNEAYVEKPDLAALQKGAVDGMLEALNDPYAQYIPASGRAEFEKEVAGQFVGIGAEVEIIPPSGGYLTIVSPMEDSPAFEAGILAGDKVAEIEGKTTLGMKIDECIKCLTGKPGTPVNLTIQRNGAAIPMTIVRREITVRAVKGFRRAPGAPGAPAAQAAWDYMIDPGSKIAYIRLTQFIPAAPDELDEALVALHADEGGISGLILDLRDNPGGDLSACLDIADLFIKSGVLVSVRGRNGEEEVHTASGEGTLPDFPVGVLVNGASASASEILAGAMSDHSRATIIGARSFGKGLVQAVVPVPHSDGAQVKFTIQRYYLPSGRLIHRTDESTQWGVDPTPGFYVPMTEQEQLAMLLKRRELDIIRARDPGAPGLDGTPPALERWADPEWIEANMKDKQLAAALRSIQGRIKAGEWKPINDGTQQAVNINMTEFHRLEKFHQRVVRELMRLEKRMENMEAALAGSVTPRTEPDLWPDDLDLTGGEVRVLDKNGNEVADARITGPDLERWLANADIQPIRTTAPSKPIPGAPAAQAPPDNNGAKQR